MDTVIARKMWRTLEPYHAMIYFTPRAAEAYAELGITGRTGYFASRSAPMGAVASSVVTATFFNFKAELVERSMAGAWETASPEALLEARLAAADAALRELLGDEVIESKDLLEAAALAREAAEACTAPGRALYAGHARLGWPEAPHLVLWHATTLLREYRGDGHIAALVAEGLGGCEALVTHGSAGLIPPALLQATRGYGDDEWASAQQNLEARGWRANGEPTSAGIEARERIEALTDELAMAPWLAVGLGAADRLRELVRPMSKQISEGGVFALSANL